MIKRVWGVYFSGTDTTKKTVSFIAKGISEQLKLEYTEFDFTLPKKRQEPLVFTEKDLVVLGLPVIAGRVPNLMLKYLDTMEGNGAIGVPVVLFGNRNFDDALIELKLIMKKTGFSPIAAGAFVGEHSFSETLGKGRPDQQDLKKMDEFKEAIIKKLPDFNGEDFFCEGSDPVRPYYTPRDRNGNGIDIRKVKPKTDPDKCVKCGLCASLCPMGSISTEDFSTINGICMKCCACVKKCPEGAKYFDDEGYLYHKSELEAMYGNERHPNAWFI